MFFSVDTTPPHINCSGDIVILLEPGATSVTVNLTTPEATDDSGVPPTVTMASNQQDPFPEGNHRVTYSAIDQAGNVAWCIVTVRILPHGKRGLLTPVREWKHPINGAKSPVGGAAFARTPGYW